MAKLRRKRLALILAAAVVACTVIGYLIDSLFFSVRDASIEEIVSDPQSFDGVHARLQGYVVNTEAYMFGPKYVLRDFDDGVEIALDGKGGPDEAYLEPYVSFVFDGNNYTEIRNIRVDVVGYVHYVCPIADAPAFFLDVEKVEPSIADLETIIIEFLKITDVPTGVWDNTIEIAEVYDDAFNGKVAVVKYATANAGHPLFMYEVVEEHVAVITLNERGEVVSAFCLWGSLHGSNRIWDLVNQRWIQR